MRKKLIEFTAKHQKEADKLSDAAKTAFGDDRTVSVFKWVHSLAAAHKEFVSELDEVTTLLENGVTVQEWIPADMELPGQEEVERYYQQYGEHPQYLVMIANAVFATILSFDGEEWYDSYTTEPYKVTHWMPLPAAPEKE